MTDDAPSTKIITNHSGGRLSSTVNPPIEKASTLTFPDRKSLYQKGTTYGRMGLSVHRELEQALAELEHGASTTLTPNGLSACTLAIASFVKAGDHVLVTDCVYGPTRRFCTERLKAMGVSVSFFDPEIGGDIVHLFQENTRVIFIESPGSLTFEFSDLPAISKAAADKSMTIIADNTWGAGVYYKPLLLGADISVQALTKYVVGHADAFGGAIICKSESHDRQVKDCAAHWGMSLGPDDAYLALRGLRTLHTRLPVHERNAVELAQWLQESEFIADVLHPYLPSFPGHDIWRRDYTGSCGLFAFVMKEIEDEALDEFIGGFELFKLGFSWGGYESLLNPADGHFKRTTGLWSGRKRPGRLVRVHAGLENIDDLKQDFQKAFTALRNHLSS